jgi:hypothetical protein
MKTQAYLFLALILFVCTGVRAQTDFEQRLLALPGLQTANKIAGQAGQPVYELYFRQPLDHGDTTKGFFQQKVFLTHRGTEEPTVIVTEGYTAPGPRYYELSELLGANQLRVEHRYFGDSQPESGDFAYLNLKQATADYHHLRELFAELYPEKWVSTGISKGGATTVIYGANDTWTATAVPPNKQVDAEWFIMEGKSHGDARIKNMTSADRARLLAAFERWLE